ncbi:DUF488 family protein [Spiractinospora alimapuensis]|uniref:DUF488 domain-containing protein n=1 Tax=Spiractinospora alimapuensis TaxID=2820884 RepID=UPI001F3C17FC|nr:DUF488 family protein [Spiractinospora alimapuensis]QVQ52125.1 DUF488 family protein [Spiractinospora alimapuensis]
MTGDDVEIMRVYDVVHGRATPRGATFLVDRLWPRGVRKDSLSLDDWTRDAAPSTELREWFNHDPARWEEFRRAYHTELDQKPDAWRPIREALRSGPVTLLFATSDAEHSNAVVLREHLLEHDADKG